MNKSNIGVLLAGASLFATVAVVLSSPFVLSDDNWPVYWGVISSVLFNIASLVMPVAAILISYKGLREKKSTWKFVISVAVASIVLLGYLYAIGMATYAFETLLSSVLLM